MTNTPLSSAEQSKVMIFALVLLPTIFVFVGIIPAIFLVFGVSMMRKSSDFAHIETAARNFKGYVQLLIAINGLFILVGASMLSIGERYSEWGDNEFLVFVSLGAIAACSFYLVCSDKLFFRPLQAHKDWIAKNGIFASGDRRSKKDSDSTEINIIRGENFKSFSVADELLKWAKLKEDGHITDQEYNEGLKKMLQGN